MSESRQDELRRLESCVAELMTTFDITTPPVPVETMLQSPRPNMWDEVDPTQLSGTFLSVKSQFSPRMSLARLLARHVIVSSWGKERDLFPVLKDEELLKSFARMLIMPQGMIMSVSASSRNPTTMSMHFEVPEEDARTRLQELASYS
jgi:hypothetical protein